MLSYVIDGHKISEYKESPGFMLTGIVYYYVDYAFVLERR